MDEQQQTMQFEHWFAELPRAYGEPVNQGQIKDLTDDFKVVEEISFEPSNEGDHVFLRIRKRDLNTTEVARKIARIANLRLVDVGYAGKKDRHAVTDQWFSVHLPGTREVDWTELTTDRIEVLEIRRHARKLRVGAINSNTFTLVIRNFTGDLAQFAERVEQIRQEGVPNYYGEQRFGFRGGNISQALEMFSGGRAPRSREVRSIIISAARSYLFNEILAARVGNQSWNQAVEGDVLMLDGSGSFFHPERLDEEVVQRVATRQIHPTGALWGRGSLAVEAECAALEQEIIAAHPRLSSGLEKLGLNQERRALRVNVRDLQWSAQEDNTLELRFALPSGSYATVVVRELLTELS